MFRRLFALVFLFIALLPITGRAEPSRLDLAGYTPVSAAVRSLILPGWGQWFNSQDANAYITGACAVISLGAAVVLTNKANATYSDYEKTGLSNDPLYSDYEAQYQQAVTVSLVTAGIWLYAVVDAYIVADNYNRKQSGLFMNHTLSSTGFTYIKRF